MTPVAFGTPASGSATILDDQIQIELEIPAGAPGIGQAVAQATTLSPGSSATASAAVSGTTVVLDFGIPQGGPGGPGEQGPIGPTGAPGAAAVIGTVAGLWNPATNTPTLGTGGAGGTAGQVYVVSTAGVQSITGASVSYQIGDLLLNVAGTSWAYIPRTAAASAFSTLVVGSSTFLDDGSGNPGVAWFDQAGGMIARIANAGVEAFEGHFTNLTASNYTGPLSTVVDSNGATLFAASPAGVTLAGQGVAPSAYPFALANQLGQITLLFDGINLIVSGNVISAQGTLGATGSQSGTFSADDLLYYETQNILYAKNITGTPNTTAMRPTSQYNAELGLGQSQMGATDANPPVLLTQPLDNLMFSQSTSPKRKLSSDPTINVATPLGDSLLHKLIGTSVAGESNGGTLITPRTGFFSNVTGVTVTVDGSNNTTFTTTQGGFNFASVFEAGDTFQVTGFPAGNGIGNNALATNNNLFQASAVSSTQLIASGAQSTQAGQATTSAVSGITFLQAAFSGGGQHMLVSCLNEVRQWELNARGLVLDPSRMRVAYAPAIAVPVLLQCPSSTYLTPSPYYWNRIVTSLQNMQAACAAGSSVAGTGPQGTGYPAGTMTVHAVHYFAGGDESGSGIDSTHFANAYATWIAAVNAEIVAVCGATQTAPPFSFISTVGGGELNDGQIPNPWAPNTQYSQLTFITANGNTYYNTVAGLSASSGGGPTGTGPTVTDGACTWLYVGPTPAVPDPCPIPMGILKLTGCLPHLGFGPNKSNPLWSPNVINVGPHYQGPDNSGAHAQAMGQVLIGCMKAKVQIKTTLQNLGFQPTCIIGVFVRGAQVLLCCNVPVPPLQVQQPYVFNAEVVEPLAGMALSDQYGVLTFTGGIPVGFGTLLLYNCNRTVDPATLFVQYAPRAGFGGNGSYCDSDTWTTLTLYQFYLGSGMLLGANMLPGLGWLVNGQGFPLWNFLCPYQAVGGVAV